MYIHMYVMHTILYIHLCAGIKSARVTAKNREDGQKGFETVIFPVEGALGSPGVCIPEEVLRQEAGTA